jgi:2-iminobutanoate/2-iminopropanoate deaminase
MSDAPKQAVSTKNAPAAIGPYSQAIIHGDVVYCSGQIPLDPQTMSVVGQTGAEQAEQVMKNIGALLEASGSSLADVLKSTIFLLDMNDFASVNEVYGSYLPAPQPARSTVQVARLPKDVRVEIEVIARLKRR